MFYIEWNGIKIKDINELTLQEVQEILASLRGSKLKHEKEVINYDK